MDHDTVLFYFLFLSEASITIFSEKYYVFMAICLFLSHLYPLITRKRLWRYVLDESAPAYRSYRFQNFSVGCLGRILKSNLSENLLLSCKFTRCSTTT